MDPKQERMLNDVREWLLQISLELATGAKSAATSLEDREAAWRHVQQMYSRLEQATHLVSRFERVINEAIKGA